MNTALRQRLLGISGVTDAVSSRIYIGPVPGSAELPYITLTRVAGAEEYTLAGFTGTVREMWQVDIWSRNAATAETVRSAILEELAVVGPVTWSSISVLVCVLDDSRDTTDVAVSGQDTRIHRKSMDFIIRFRRGDYT